MPSRPPVDDVAAAYKVWNECFNRGDAAAVGRLYAADAVFLPATHEVVRGPAAIEAFFRPMLAAGVTRHANEVITAGSDGALVYGASRWTVDTPDAEGRPQTSSGIATHVFARQPDGSLLIQLHTFN